MTTNPTSCTTCGQPHVRCTAHTKSGKPCGQPPMTGQRVCRKHGGKAPQNLAAAERRIQERAALLALESFGVPVVVDPHTALLQELHRTAGAVAWLGAIVADLDRESIGWGRSEEVKKTSGEFPGTDTTSAAKPNVWYEMWTRERKHLVEVAKACHNAGIEDRRIRVVEAQAQLLAGTITRVLDRLGLTDSQRELVATVVPEELRATAELEASAS